MDMYGWQPILSTHLQFFFSNTYISTDFFLKLYIHFDFKDHSI